MRTTLRLGLLAAIGLAALASAAVALASFSPKLNMSRTATGGTNIGFLEGVNDVGPAKVAIFVDKALSVNLSAAPGTTIGTADAKAAAGALGGAVLPLSGKVVVRGAGDTFFSNGAQLPLAAAATACTGSATHTAFWALVLSAAGQTIEVPVFVDAIAASDPRSAFADASLTLCLPSASVPPPQGAAFGAKVIVANLKLKGVFASSPGEYRFRALITPYTEGTATVNAAGTVEVQGLDRQPGAITIVARKKGVGQATVTGTLTEAGKGVAGAKVTIKGGKKTLIVTTAASGAYKATVSLKSLVAKLQASAAVPLRDLGASQCMPTFGSLGIPCADASVGGFAAASAAVRPR